MLVLLAAGVKLAHLRSVAETLDDNWDLLDRIEAPAPLPALAIDGWLAEFDAVCGAGVDCRAETDRMLTRLDEFAEYRDRLRAAFDDAERIELLRADKPSFRVGTHREQEELGRHRRAARTHREAGRAAPGDDRCGARRRDQARGRRDRGLHRAVGCINAEHPVSSTSTTCSCSPRTLLRDPEHGVGARARLWERYQRILIDEFQDTDPIQVELAALLGSDDPADGDRTVERDERRPRAAVLRRRSQAVDLPVPPRRHRDVPRGARSLRATRAAVPHLQLPDRARGARLDQSRVRRADPALRRVRSPSTGRSTRRATCRRTTIAASCCSASSRMLRGGSHRRGGAAPARSRRRRRDRARAAVAEKWPVFDKERDEWRPARLGDICILLPARTSLGYLEQALGRSGGSVPGRDELARLQQPRGPRPA